MVFLAHYSDLLKKKCWEFVAVPIRRVGETIKQCSFHSVPHFGECLGRCYYSCGFMFWELDGTFAI